MQGDVPSRSLLWPVAAAITAYLLAIALIGDISGDFPINDDWAYSLPVEWAHRWGVLRFTNWQYMTLIGQTLLGWLWTALFGFSYFGLRILTLIVGGLGLLAFFLLARLATGRDRLAALLTCGWMVNPVFLASTASFMTDIYFWAAATGSILCLFLALERKRGWLWAAGWALAIFAMAIRQMAVAIPLGLLVADLARNGCSWRSVIRAVPSLAVMLLLLTIFNRVVGHSIGLPSQYPLPAQQLSTVLDDIFHLHPKAFQPAIRGLATGCLYLGFFGMPLALFLAATTPVMRGLLPWCIAIAGWLILVVTHQPLPLAGNTLQTWGIGPRTLADMPAPIHAGWLAYVLSLLACWSLGMIVGAAVLGLRDGQPIRIKLRRCWMPIGLIVTAAIGYAPLILVYGPWFDRHMLMAAPLLLIALAAVARVDPLSTVKATPAWLLVSLAGLVSIALVHDYFAWQRTRWAVAEQGTARHGVPPLRIDGGFEYNNLLRHPAEPGVTSNMPAPLLGRPDYARCFITAGPMAGVHRVEQADVKRWLPLGSPSLTLGCRD